MLVELVKRINLAAYSSYDLEYEILVIGVLLTRPTQAISILADLESINTTEPF